MWKLLFIALFVFGNTASAIDPPKFTPTSTLARCEFPEIRASFPCFTAEKEGDKLIVLLDEKFEIWIIAKVENGQVVKTIWRADWKNI